VWPLDKFQSSGIQTVPGFVIELVGNPSNEVISDLSEDFWDDFRQALLELRAGMVNLEIHEPSAIVEWQSTPEIHGVARSFDSWEFIGGSESSHGEVDTTILVERKRFVEHFTNCVSVGAPLKFSDIDWSYLTDANFERSRGLNNNTLQAIIAKYLELFRQTYGSQFPHTLFDQLKYVINFIYQNWRHTASALVADRSISYLSVCVRAGLRLRRDGLQGSGIIFSGDLANERIEDVFGFYSPLHTLNDIGAGIAPLVPIAEILDSDVEVRDQIYRLNNWVSTQPIRTLKLEFVKTKAGILVDNVCSIDVSIEKAIKIASTIIEEQKSIDPAAIIALNPKQLDELFLPSLSPTAQKTFVPVGKGIGASPGACSGLACMSPAKVEELRAKGHPVIFISRSPLPELMKGVLSSDGLVFATGGATSHVAVIARGSNKPCVLGVGNLSLDFETRRVNFGTNRIDEGDWITIDGSTGSVYTGQIEVVRPSINSQTDLQTLLGYCDRLASVRVYVNADVADEARVGFDLGAQGIGLCRLEHLLLRPEILPSLQRAVVFALAVLPLSQKIYQAKDKMRRWPKSAGASSVLAEATANATDSPVYMRYRSELEHILSHLTRILASLLTCADGKPVVIRLLDPPLSEFLSESVLQSISGTGVLSDGQMDFISDLICRRDAMLGLRGVRLCHLAPELTSTQLSGIFKSARDIAEARRRPVEVDIMAPFVIDPIEITTLRTLAEFEVRQALRGANEKVTYRLGCMIETPRSVMLAGDIAKVADFISVGTNDLTQFTWACSRDYAEKDFLEYFPYTHFKYRPFTEFDKEGVGGLISLAVTKAREAAPGIPIGICGEHGRDAEAIKFFHRLNINYVSCSPFSVPISRLAAAQAADDNVKRHG
jgi:pyruvate,orthophosphate dikinase